MRSFFDSPIFSQIEDVVGEIASKINSYDVIQILTPADLEGVLSLIQLESSLLDASKNYRRKILPQKKYVSGDEYSLPDLEGLKIVINPFMESNSNLSISDDVVEIAPISVEFNTETSNNNHQGAIDTVAICSCIASTISPNGTRVRKVRPLAIAGNWLRQGVEINYDPVYSLLRDHLNEEGTIDVRPITETNEIAGDMLPELSSRMLKKLKQRWPEMSYEERSSALSELILPILRNDKISTMRIEELIWHRMLIPGCNMDIASQLKIAEDNWPADDEKARLHASMIADKLIVDGFF